MTARTQAFILLLFGGALTRLALSDALLRYVRPSARLWVLLAGLAIVGLAIWNVIAAVRGAAAHSPAAPAPTDEGPADLHGHGATTRIAWLVLAPILAILVIAPPALGSFSAAHETTRVPQPVRVDFPPLPAGDPAPLSLLNFATRVIWDHGHTVIGRRVRMSGFVLKADAQGFILTRLVISCCAADAQPVNIEILGAGTQLAVNSWATVTGTYAGVSPTQQTLPLLRASSVEPITQPANPYDD